MALLPLPDLGEEVLSDGAAEERAFGDEGDRQEPRQDDHD